MDFKQDAKNHVLLFLPFALTPFAILIPAYGVVGAVASVLFGLGLLQVRPRVQRRGYLSAYALFMTATLLLLLAKPLGLEI